MKGSIKTVTLSGSPDVTATFQLPRGASHYRDNPHQAPMPRGGGFHSHPYSAKQLKVMMDLYREHYDMYEVYQDISEDDFWTDNVSAKPVGPEWVFHGSSVDWDAFYNSGGIRVMGGNLDISQHVHSSSSSGSAYVATSRQLSVAHSFAKATGWVYLIYAVSGMEVYSSLHNQAEVVIPGQVPIRDIYMFRNLAHPNSVYVNNEYVGPHSSELEAHCVSLLTGTD